MSYTVKYDENMDCILVTIQGNLDLKVLRSVASEVSLLMGENDCKPVLNDMRKATLSKGIMEVYRMPQVAKDQGIKPICKRAIVIPKDAPEFHFLETVFVNQGHIVKFFTDIDAAKEWLFSEN